MSIPYIRASLRRLAVSAALASTLAAAATAQVRTTVIMTGLDNPRGVAVGPAGDVYVAESGRGGAGSCAVGGEGLVCFGSTGGVSRWFQGRQERIVSGLPSLAGEGGGGATGAHDVAVAPGGGISVVIGLGMAPANRASFPEGFLFGRVLHYIPRNGTADSRDVSAHETANNPDGAQVDSNPYGVAWRGALRAVTDAGANALVGINAAGQTSTLAMFPPRLTQIPNAPEGAMYPMESVPTGVTVGPDGAFYVGELTGFPFQPGAARVHRVDPNGTSRVYAAGFTNIIDVTFGPDGSLYVLELARDFLAQDMRGRLTRIAPGGQRTVVLDQGLFAPGGVAVDRSGAIYVSNASILPGAGQVLRIDAPVQRPRSMGAGHPAPAPHGHPR